MQIVSIVNINFIHYTIKPYAGEVNVEVEFKVVILQLSQAILQ